MPAICFVPDQIRGMIGSVVRVAGCILVQDGLRRIRIERCRLANSSDDIQWLLLAKPEWVVKSKTFVRLLEIVSELPLRYRRVIDATFEEEKVLRAFLEAPASLRGHHVYRGGCLDHSVETVELVLCFLQALQETTCDEDTSVVAALLHDVGKALEYRTSATARGGQYSMSLKGELSGHKLSGHSMIDSAIGRAAFRAQSRGDQTNALSNEEGEVLLHCMTATYAEAHVGLRVPITPEAHLVSQADSMSAKNEIFLRCAPDPSSGTAMGQPHAHISKARNRPFYIKALKSVSGLNSKAVVLDLKTTTSSPESDQGSAL